MSTGWENHEPAPVEYLHSKLMEYFHELRKERSGKDIYIKINGVDLNHIIARGKTDVYKKYPKQVSDEAILKTEM